MASKQDIIDIKKTLQELRKTNFDLQLRVETLEDRVAALESGEVVSTKPKEPEPILTCVQCTYEYRESENAEGSCFYHSGSLLGQGWEYKYSACCGKGSRNYESAKTIPGCVKGKHRSKHHTDYHYSRYVFYMQEQSKKAQEKWLEMDVEDLVTNCCEWAEVGLSNEGNLFILVGTSRVKSTAIAVYSSEELQNLKGETVVALDLTDPVGWTMKAELLAANGKANAVQVSIKPASSKVALVKQVEIMFSETGNLQGGEVKVLSDPYSKQEKKEYTVPEDVKEGPVLDSGQDHSVNRKNDYQTETTGSCPLKLQQHGTTEVASSTRVTDGQWNNLFSCTAKVTNTSKENVAVSDAYGEYMNKEGDWVKCDEIFIGKEFFRGNYDWFDTPNFWLPEGSTTSLLVRLCIKFNDAPPESNYEGRRAHSSLPQPLHLRFTFIDQNDDKASLRFEQGNKPLDLATRERRIEGWCRKKEADFLYWNFADNANTKKRSDVGVYYGDGGIVSYRPALNDNASNTYYISTKQKSIGFQAKAAGEKEFLIQDWKKETKDKDSSIIPYALVDLDNGFMYGMKIVITTPTSKTVGSFLLPDMDIKGTLSVTPDKIVVKGEMKVKWEVSRASTSDTMYVYKVHGTSNIAYVNNSKGFLEGESTFKAPSVPGDYEVRYYPSSLKGQNYGYYHNKYIATAKFRVIGAV